ITATPRKPDLNLLLTHLAHALDQPDVLGRVALQGQPCLEKARTGILLRPLTSHVHIHLTHFTLAVTHTHAQLQLGSRLYRGIGQQLHATFGNIAGITDQSVAFPIADLDAEGGTEGDTTRLTHRENALVLARSAGIARIMCYQSGSFEAKSRSR